MKILGYIAGHLFRKYLIVLILSIILSPVLFFIFHPEKDAIYHTNNKKYIEVHDLKDIKDNTYVRIKGKIDENSVLFNTDIIAMQLKSCTFRFKNYPLNFVVFIRNGEYFEHLNQIYSVSEGNELLKYLDKENIADEKIKFKSKRRITDLNSGLTEVMKSLEDKKEFEGRIYSSKGILKEFDSYYYRKNLDIGDYYYQLGETFNFNSELSDFFKKNFKIKSNTLEYFVLVVDEKPSIRYLINTNFSIFAFVFISFLSIIVSLQILFKKTNNKKTSEINDQKTNDMI